jgi:hypothetical protein
MTRSSSAVSAVILAASLLAGCITSGGKPYPLYPGEPRPLSEVARLLGPIGSVDGQDVSAHGKSFSLLPGCHIVKLAAKTGEINSLGSGGYVVNLPPAVYAFRMQAQHSYEIQVQVEAGGGPTGGRVTIRAWDRDANGAGLEVSPASSSAEIPDCANPTS